MLRSDPDSATAQTATLAMWSIVHGLALDQQLCEMAGSGRAERYEELADGVPRVLLGRLNNRRMI